MHYDARPRYDACVLVKEGVDYSVPGTLVARRYLKPTQSRIKQHAMVHAHRCRFPLPCETHKVGDRAVLRSVLSRLRLYFPEHGPPLFAFS